MVDDNEDAVDMLKMLMEYDGHQIKTAYDGTTAIEIARDFSPEIVCLDIGLPDMDGYLVARQLRQMSATRRMALVAMTGRRQDKARQAGVDAGFDHYMIKPIDFEKLMAIIETLDKY